SHLHTLSYNPWYRGASATSDRPTLLNAHTASDAKARHTAMVTISVIASATSFGMRICNQCCSGQTVPMTKSAIASGAKTLAASYAANAIATTAIVAVEILTSASAAIRWRPYL